MNYFFKISAREGIFCAAYVMQQGEYSIVIIIIEIWFEVYYHKKCIYFMYKSSRIFL